MSGIIGDNLGRSSGLIKAVEAAAGSEWTSLGTTTFTSDASTFDYEPTWLNHADGYNYVLVRLTLLNIHPDTNNSEVYMRYKGAADADGAIAASYATSGYYSGGFAWDYNSSQARSSSNGSRDFYFDPNMNNGTDGNDIRSHVEMFIHRGGECAYTNGGTDRPRMLWWKTSAANGSNEGATVLGHAWNGTGFHGLQLYPSGGGNMDGDVGAVVYAHYNNVLGTF